MEADSQATTVNFTETKLKGAFLIDLEKREDLRGHFARTFCQREFVAYGLKMQVVQCSLSYNQKKGTLRGMHFQVAPHEEAKLIRCTKGAIYDVILDLRRGSPTFKQHFAVELSAKQGNMLFVPEGLAHGFQTIEDDTEVFYQMSEFYAAESSRGVRWNDPAFGISWPEVPERIIIERDQKYPSFEG